MLSIQAIVLAFYGSGTALTTSPSGLGKPAPIVGAILRANVTAVDRMKALEPFLNVGMTERGVDRVLGPPMWVLGHGPGFSHGCYSVENADVVVGFYPNGEVYRITYKGKDGTSVVLRSDDPITWPKTTDGHNAKLREWKKNREK